MHRHNSGAPEFGSGLMVVVVVMMMMVVVVVEIIGVEYITIYPALQELQVIKKIFCKKKLTSTITLFALFT